MMNSPVRPPGSQAELARRIERYASQNSQTVGRVRVTIGQVVVAQLMPSAVVKGGSGMKFRLGSKFTRDSKDLDVAWRSEQSVFAGLLSENLRAGWGPFAGVLLEQHPRHEGRGGYPPMQPYLVKLTIYNRAFCTVKVEVGWDELGATEDGSDELLDPQGIVEMFLALGLDRPEPVRLLAPHHQIAQKIHACTEPGSVRAHDLVDLQLLWPQDEEGLDLVAATTRRQFAYRRLHDFPGKCTPSPDWEESYRVAGEGLDVIDGVDDAAAWLNAKLEDLATREG